MRQSIINRNAAQVRAYTAADRAAVEGIWKRSGLEYALPDLENPLYLIKGVVEERGKVVMACAGKLTAEAFVFVDPEGAPHSGERARQLFAMHQWACDQAWKPGGLDEIFALLAPPIEHRFGRQLRQLGWRRNFWNAYTRDLSYGEGTISSSR